MTFLGEVSYNAHRDFMENLPDFPLDPMLPRGDLIILFNVMGWDIVIKCRIVF